ncbi:MAG TPA: hypothetical protein VK826_18955 [Bacteroidia bacterium]|nr:hypothetical protein [Bacteroidia bacterium]
MENIIEIPTGNADALESVMNDFNQRYKTDFKIREIEDRDGVIFVVVDQGSADSSNVFMFGLFYGMWLEDKRAKKEIDY